MSKTKIPVNIMQNLDLKSCMDDENKYDLFVGFGYIGKIIDKKYTSTLK